MGVSYRSVIIGFVLIPLNAVWLALAEQIWYSGATSTLSIYANVVTILCILTAGNAALAWLRRDWALSASELLVVYVMLAVATSLGGHDMLPVLVPAISHLRYHNAVEGLYGEILRHVPPWLIINDWTALESAYLGEESIFRCRNLVPWLGPLAWWFAFVAALCAVMWGLNLVFRKQWTEHEKLAYPLIQVPMILANEARSLIRSRAFWIALAIAGGIQIANGLNVLYPMFPKIQVIKLWDIQTLFTQRPWTDMGIAWITLFPCVVGLSFFIPLDLAFSCWFFFIYWKAQRILASHLGLLGMGGGFPYAQEQAVGGFYAIALIALWISRRQLKRTALLLMGRPVEGATPWDRREPYLAVALLLAGALFLFGFCSYAGMTPLVTVLFFFFYYLLSVGITRMRVELGPASHDVYPVGAHRQVMDLLGPIHMKRTNPVDLVMFGFLAFFNRCMRTHPMPTGMESFKIGERMKMRPSRIFVAMWVAVIWGTLWTFATLVWAFNKYGITARSSGLPDFFGAEAWENVRVVLSTPPEPSSGPLVAIGVGVFTALGLAAMRLNLAWWPFHPVGYAISASLTMERIWFCILVAWLIKTLSLKYGGVTAYRSVQRFGVGLILGDFIVGTFWFTYGALMEVKVYDFYGAVLQAVISRF